MQTNETGETGDGVDNSPIDLFLNWSSIGSKIMDTIFTQRPREMYMFSNASKSTNFSVTPLMICLKSIHNEYQKSMKDLRDQGTPYVSWNRKPKKTCYNKHVIIPIEYEPHKSTFDSKVYYIIDKYSDSDILISLTSTAAFTIPCKFDNYIYKDYTSPRNINSQRWAKKLKEKIKSNKWPVYVLVVMEHSLDRNAYVWFHLKNNSIFEPKFWTLKPKKFNLKPVHPLNLIEGSGSSEEDVEP